MKNTAGRSLYTSKSVEEDRTTAACGRRITRVPSAVSSNHIRMKSFRKLGNDTYRAIDTDDDETNLSLSISGDNLSVEAYFDANDNSELISSQDSILPNYALTKNASSYPLESSASFHSNVGLGYRSSDYTLEETLPNRMPHSYTMESSRLIGCRPAMELSQESAIIKSNHLCDQAIRPYATPQPLRQSATKMSVSISSHSEKCTAVSMEDQEKDPRERLIEAIESLRDSIHDNTVVQSRMSKPRQRRGNTQSQSKGITMLSKSDEKLKLRKEKVAVEIRVVFLKIGEIDTLKEFYHADVFIQAKWREPRLDGTSNEDLLSIDLEKYWSPLLYIDNILTETKDAQWSTVQLNDSGEAYVYERRRVKGVFLETLELNDFPLDVQDLTVTLTTERPDTEIDLIPDQLEMSAINIQTFVDQQEWKLHEHVEISKRIMTQEYSSSMKSHPCISVTCRAARRPGYFYWNVFLIMFMISGLSFATFAVTPDKAEYRLRLSFTLVLTSVTFKYVITQSLPKISYLTYMDKYVLMSLAILCVVSIWHAVITLIPQHMPKTTPPPVVNTMPKVVPPTTAASKLIIPENGENNLLPGLLSDNFPFFKTNDTPKGGGGLPPLGPLPNTKLDDVFLIPEMGQKLAEQDVKKRSDDRETMIYIEKHVFISFCVCYIIAHLIFIFWLYFDASKRRREMTQKDKEYREHIKKENLRNSFRKRKESLVTARRISSTFVYSI